MTSVDIHFIFLSSLRTTPSSVRVAQMDDEFVIVF